MNDNVNEGDAASVVHSEAVNVLAPVHERRIWGKGEIEYEYGYVNENGEKGKSST